MKNYSTTTYVGLLNTLRYKKQLIHSTKYLWHVTNNCSHVLHGTRAGSEEAAARIVLVPQHGQAAVETCILFPLQPRGARIWQQMDGHQCLRVRLPRGEGTAADTSSADHGWLCCWDARANPRRRCSFALAVWTPTTQRATTRCCPSRCAGRNPGAAPPCHRCYYYCRLKAYIVLTFFDSFRNKYGKPQPIRTKVSTHAQVKGRQRSRNFGRNRLSVGEMGAKQCPRRMSFFVGNTRRLFGNFATADFRQILDTVLNTWVRTDTSESDSPAVCLPHLPEVSWDNSVPVPKCLWHFGTKYRCRSVLGPKCPGAEVSVKQMNEWIWFDLISNSQSSSWSIAWMRQWGVNNLPKVVAQQRHGRASNPRPLDRKSDRSSVTAGARTYDPWIASPTPYRLATPWTNEWINECSLVMWLLSIVKNVSFSLSVCFCVLYFCVFLYCFYCSMGSPDSNKLTDWLKSIECAEHTQLSAGPKCCY